MVFQRSEGIYFMSRITLHTPCLFIDLWFFAMIESMSRLDTLWFDLEAFMDHYGCAYGNGYDIYIQAHLIMIFGLVSWLLDWLTYFGWSSKYIYSKVIISFNFLSCYILEFIWIMVYVDCFIGYRGGLRYYRCPLRQRPNSVRVTIIINLVFWT